MKELHCLLQLSDDLCFGSVSAENDGPTPPPTNNMALILVSAVAFIVIVALLLGVLFTVSRKRSHASTWFPEGFRRTPDGQEMSK